MTCKDIIRGTDRGPSVPTSCLRSTANSTTSLPSYRAPALATSIGFRLFTAQIRHFDGHLRFTFFLKVPRQHYHQLLSPSQPSASGGLASPGTLSSLTSTSASGGLASPDTLSLLSSTSASGGLASPDTLGPQPPRSFLTPTSAHAACCHPFQR